ncbi:S8 family serine peptidase [Streptomyces sp. NBC_01336]|uniref:S8 family serine peptidase n=1 Tax=Streptomyces sp. NBC_01336 TaxID=2903829 RepID=UPI002E0DBCDA|nr:S8 family serine peptidase [Streptomyces sp. NBC_01336]
MTSSHPRRRRLLVPAIAVLSLALGGGALLPTPAGADGGARSATAGKTGPSPMYDVTLVTGDVVHYTDLPGSSDPVTVDTASGSHGGVQIQTYGTNTYVIPAQAAGLIAADRLDVELFNVTGLVEMGYDDARSGGTPLIATAPKGAGDGRAARSSALPGAPAGSKRVRALAAVRATALKTDARRARAFWAGITPDTPTAPRSLDADTGIGKLWLDRKIEPTLSESVPQVRAPEAWAEGFDGTGSKVAVLDTGIDATHPDVKGAIVASKSFVPGESTDDKVGHGTHVASTIAGSGAASDGAKKGVAPGAALYVGKVLSDAGEGTESAIIEGMQWARDEGVDVVSMSLGTNTASDGVDPVSQAVNALSADGGPLFVVAAGNNADVGSIGSPGAAEAALTVGAVNKQDTRAAFSSQGPVRRTYAIKPDISAPGVSISAAAAHPAEGGPMYQSMTGTSMATPHVAGGAAVLHQAHPDWDAARLKSALMSSSKKLNAFTPYQLGAGRLDVAAAVDSTIEAPGSLGTVAVTWQNKDDGPAERTITYRNTGTADVTLDLALDTRDDHFTLSRPSVTVPAKGAAEVTLRLDPSAMTTNSAVSGQVTATDTARAVMVAHTAFALLKEPELYDYTLELRDRDGKPTTGTIAMTYPGSAAPGFVTVYGRTTLRLPPRMYTAWGFLDVAGDRADEQGLALVAAPDVQLGDGGATVRLDASLANRVAAVTPRETENRQTVVQFRRTFPDGRAGAGSAFVMDSSYDALYVQPTDEAAGAQDLLVHWRQQQKSLDARTGSGHDVQLTAQNGAVPSDGRRTLRTVYAGKGTGADYAGLDVKGKAVVVDRRGASPDERAEAAANAGAALLITVNDRRGRLYETYTDAHGLTVAGVRQSDGARLIEEAESGRGTLTVTGRRSPAYQYDLLEYRKGAIPDHDLVYRPRESELARVQTNFHAAWTDGVTPEGVGRRVFSPYWGKGAASNETESYPAARTDFLTALPETLGAWHEEHRAELGGPGADNVIEIAADRGYASGGHYTGEWFAPVVAPRFGESFWRPSRTSNGVSWNLPAWSGAGAGHTAMSPGVRDGSVTVQFRQGDSLLTTGLGYSGYATGLPAAEQAYSITLDAARDTAKWDKSTRTHTRWDFRSAAPPQGTPSKEVPLLDLRYDVGTDLRGDLPAGRKVTLGLHSSVYRTGAAADSATLQVSYDEGSSWRAVPLTKAGDGRWTVRLVTPRTKGGSVSLRASAQGPDGLAVTQDVIRAFGMK